MSKRKKQIVALFMVLITVFGTFNFNVFNASAATTTNYVTAQRTASATTIYPDEEVSVTLNVTGTPPVNVVKPNDVVLVLDKSGSMLNDDRFNAMISSAKQFIDLVDFSSHQVGIVDFSSSDNVNSKELSTNATDLKTYLDGVQCGGGTYTDVAINKAMDVLAQGRSDAQPVIILLTDGEATKTDLALQAATKAKEAGIVFYTIALLAPDEDPDASAPNALLKDMATTAQHHHFVLGSVGLIDIYKAIVKEIGIASAYEVNISETVGPEFEIVPDSYSNNIPAPTVTGNTLVWNMQELKADTLSLSYKVRLKAGVGAGTYSLAPNTKITYKDYAGAARTYSVANTSITVKNRPPAITGITPGSGPIAGGNIVTITGNNFLTGANVKFNSTQATNIQVVDSKTITATVPAGIQGKATVTVTNPDTQYTTYQYQYLADPTITSISPNNGVLEGGNNVKINGQYFVNGLTVYFGDKIAPTYTYYNSTYLYVTVPAGTQAGAVDVKVVNPDGTTVVAGNGYTYNEKVVEKLSITTVSPNSGIVTGGNSVTITGTKFASDAKVYFGDVEGTVTASTGTTSKTVKVPASTTVGVVDVKIVNPDGETGILTGGYEYLPVPPPTITTLSLTQGQLAGGEYITITGKNFQPNITAKVGGIDAVVANYYNSTSIRIITPAGTATGKVDVTVTNPDGQSGSIVGGFEYLPLPEEAAPTITSLSVTEGQLAGGEILYINGTNFKSGLTVTFGGKTATLLNYYSATSIRVQVPAGTTDGLVDVTVTNPSGKQATLTGGYKYLPLPEEQPPTITSLSATEGQLAGGEIIYINGTNFKSGLTVTIGNQTATLLNYYSATSIRVKVPAATIDGSVDVTVTNPSGKQGTLTGGYKYLPVPEEIPPTITSLSLTEGELTGGEIVTITGTNFKSGLTVKFGANQATLLNYYSDTSIRIQVPAATTSGLVNVTVTNPSGKEGVLTDGYKYKEYIPQITSLSVTSGLITDSTITYITGKNFAQGLTVTVGGQPATLLNYYSSTSIRVQLPKATVAGKVDVVVQNPNGAQGTLTGGYEYLPLPTAPLPTISCINSSSADTTTTLTGMIAKQIVYIHGANFILSGTSKSTVRIVDSSGVTYNITPLNLYNATTMRIQLPTAIAKGAAQLYIVNGTDLSAPFSITIQ